MDIDRFRLDVANAMNLLQKGMTNYQVGMAGVIHVSGKKEVNIKNSRLKKEN